MKRILLALLGVAMLASTAMAAAVTSVSWTIGVSFSAFTIDLTALPGDTMTSSFGTVSANNVIFSNFTSGQPRSTIKNNGSGTISYTALATIAGGWTLAAAPGANIATLQGIFTKAVTLADDPANGLTLAAGNFQANDILTGTAQTATANILGDDNDTTTPVIKGNNVDPTNSTRNLRYRFQAPTSATITVPQTITVTIGAV
jgi:hypothetical protein